MGRKRLELLRPRGRQILSLLRLPISPPALGVFLIITHGGDL